MVSNHTSINVKGRIRVFFRVDDGSLPFSVRSISSPSPFFVGAGSLPLFVGTESLRSEFVVVEKTLC